MSADHHTLLIAVTAACCAVSFTFFVSWLSGRVNSVLATFAGSFILLAAAVILFMSYQTSTNMLVGYTATSVLLMGVLANFTAARQFRTGVFSPRSAIALWFILSAILAIPYGWGFDAIPTIASNFIFATILAATAHQFWQCRSEQKAIVTVISTLYVAVGSTFVACGLVVISKTPLVLDGPPTGWAETLNLIVCALGIGAIGTLIVALNQNRISSAHRHAARTDPLTGMFNRRALFETYGEQGIPPQTSVIMLDLDNFKFTNDTYGHDAGDQVLVLFANICRSHIAENDYAVRMGGEEFVIVLADSSPAKALKTAEAIRSEFARSIVRIDHHEISSTVSIGVHTNVGSTKAQIDDVLKTADQALYRAKSEGRNLVRAAAWLEAA